MILFNYKLSDLPFHCHHSPAQDQLKWTTASFSWLLQNHIKLLIVLPKFKALLEWGQQLYTKNAASWGLVFVQRRNVYRTRENLVTWVPVDFYRYRAYLTTIHWPLKCGWSFNTITSNRFTLYPNLLSTLGILRQSKEGGTRFPRDSERLQINVINQLLIPQIMGFLGPKAI